MGKRPKGYRWSLPLLMVAGLLGSANKAPATEPLRWSVREAIGYALEHSPNVAVAQSKVDEKEEAKKVVFSGPEAQRPVTMPLSRIRHSRTSEKRRKWFLMKRSQTR